MNKDQAADRLNPEQRTDLEAAVAESLRDLDVYDDEEDDES